MAERNFAVVVTDSLWPFDGGLRSPSGNGFHQRYARVIRAIAESADVFSVVILCLDSSQPMGAAETIESMETMFDSDRVTRIFRIRVNPRDFGWGIGPDQKGRLLKRMIRNVFGHPVVEAWQAEVAAALQVIAPTEVVLLNGGYFWTLYRGISDPYPTVSFVEEDFWASRMGRGLPVHQRWFVRLDDFIAKRVYRSPDCVVAISPNEFRWLQQTFPRSRHRVIPLSIDVEYWSAPVSSPVKGDVFTIAGLEPRRGQDDDFTQIISETFRLRPKNPFVIRLAGVIPPDPSGAPRRIEIPGVEFLGAVTDPRPFYAGASIILVPAFQVTGVKTTILQAWVAGRPVVTTSAAANSVGGTHGVNLLAGGTPAEVAQLVVDLLDDQEMQERLIEGGRKRFWDSFSPGIVDSAVFDALDEVVG